LVLSALQQTFVLSQVQESQVQACVESVLQQQAASTFVLSAAVASALAAFLPPQDITANEKATAMAAINTFVFIFVIALNV
jgi:hypothetical protein